MKVYTNHFDVTIRDHIGNLDQTVGSNTHTRSSSYALRVRCGAQALQETEGLSADDLSDEGVEVVTLFEELLLRLYEFWETEGACCKDCSVTLCAGSRTDDGYVPTVHWSDGRELRIERVAYEACDTSAAGRKILALPEGGGPCGGTRVVV